MRKKLLYTVVCLSCFSMLASSNNYKKTGKEKMTPCEERKISESKDRDEEAMRESWPLNHFLLSLAEW